MAKKYYKAPIHQVGTHITTKTHFGTTSDMVVDHTKYVYSENNAPITLPENLPENISYSENEAMGAIVCKDDRGFYLTFKNRVDSGLADPNRYDCPQMRIDIKEATEENVSSA